jgi:tetratricopeptide (TPR) repeat protein
VTDQLHDEVGTPWPGWVDTSALLSQAQACESAGSLRHAEVAYNSLIVAATRQQDHATLSVAFRRRAVLAHQSGDSARARSALQQSYAVATMMGDRRLTAETLNTLGGLELETRNLEAAEAALLEAETLASADPTILARVEQNLGIVSNIRGDLELAETSRDVQLVALCLLNHAEVLVALGGPGKARENAEAAERMFQGLGVHFDAGDVYRVLALCDRAEGQLRQAETRLIQARELSRQTGARLTEAEVLRELGRLYAETGRAAEGRALLHEAAQTFAGLGARGDAEATEREAGRLGEGVAIY